MILTWAGLENSTRDCLVEIGCEYFKEDSRFNPLLKGVPDSPWVEQWSTEVFWERDAETHIYLISDLANGGGVRCLSPFLVISLGLWVIKLFY